MVNLVQLEPLGLLDLLVQLVQMDNQDLKAHQALGESLDLVENPELQEQQAHQDRGENQDLLDQMDSQDLQDHQDLLGLKVKEALEVNQVLGVNQEHQEHKVDYL